MTNVTAPEAKPHSSIQELLERNERSLARGKVLIEQSLALISRVESQLRPAADQPLLHASDIGAR